MRIIPHNVHMDLKAYVSGVAADLTPAALDWFRANKDFALTRPHELYIGKHLSETEGLKLLNGAQAGGMVSYTQPTCSVWTSALDDARRASLKSDRTLFPAIRQGYLTDETINPTDIGVVLTALITPEDVACSLERVDRLCQTRLSSLSVIGDVILRPKPSMLARVVNIFTKDSLTNASMHNGMWNALGKPTPAYDLEFPGAS